jgi:phenylpropionate dioxygenase-like ring-hydroxylating dioxygenase large terminal subunit
MDQLPFDDLIIDDRVNGIFRVNRRGFTDPAILDIEKREIFDKSWLYAGHASEIAQPGDFVTRRVGSRPLILVRDRAGQPRAAQQLSASRQHRLPRGRRLGAGLCLLLPRLEFRSRRLACRRPR